MYEYQLHPFIVPAFLSLFFIWSMKRWFYKANATKNLPPSPTKLPIIGNLHQLGSLPHRNLRRLSEKHGPLMLLHFGQVPVVVVSSADVASQVLKTHDITFAHRPPYKAFKKLIYDAKNITFSPYGQHWRHMKSIFVLQLLSTKKIQSFRPIREEETALLVKRIGGSSGTVNLSEMFAEFATDVISRSVFGFYYREVGNGKNVLRLLEELMELLGTLSIGDFISWLGWLDYARGYVRRLDKVAKGIDDFLEDVIQQRLQHGRYNQENFLDTLLENHNGDATGDFLGRNSIKALVLDALAGGTYTVSTALEWVMTELLQHPTVMEKLQNEVREVVQRKQDISDDDLEKMQYMKAVIKESLRYHPPTALLVPRLVHEDVKVKGYNISKGTLAMVNIWAIGRDPACWDEPDKFKPDRFLNCSTDSKLSNNIGWIPFGAGRRGCPGVTYSMAMIELSLANIVQKFDWKLPKGVVMDLTEATGLSTHKAIPLLALPFKTSYVI